MWRTGGLHALAKTGRRPTLTIANQEQPSHDDSKEREWDRFRTRRFQRKKRRNLSPVSKIAETLCGEAHHWNRLAACSSIEYFFPLGGSLPLQLGNECRLSPVARRVRVCQADAHANAARSHLRRVRC